MQVVLDLIRGTGPGDVITRYDLSTELLARARMMREATEIEADVAAQRAILSHKHPSPTP